MSLLACQRDSYLRSASSEVISCNKLPDGLFSVVLRDSVLYPEGGGQPCDLGTIGGSAVIAVNKATHNATGVEVITNDSFNVGQYVVCEVDWPRRFDFMQQHTAQHLLSAVADILFSADTVRWELGKDIVTVDVMHEGLLSDDQIRQLEERVNEEVRRNRNISYLTADKESLSNIEGLRGVPKGAAMEFDTLRLVSIDGLDVNPCGGTHVRSTGEVQTIKVVSQTQDRGATRIGFVAGNRVLSWFGVCLKRDASLGALLSVGASDFEDAVSRLLLQRKETLKEKKALLEELATRVGSQLASDVKTSACPVVCYHRPKADVSFLLSVADAVLNQVPTALVFLASIDDNCITQPVSKVSKKKPSAVTPEPSYRMNSTGVFVFAGTAPDVNAMKTIVMEAVGGRGGGRPGRIQGQAERLEKYKDVEHILLSAASDNKTKA